MNHDGHVALIGLIFICTLYLSGSVSQQLAEGHASFDHLFVLQDVGGM